MTRCERNGLPPASAEAPVGGRCEGCGQECLADDAWTVRGLCAACRASQYGGGKQHEAPRLFEPAPEQVPGQLAMPESWT